tara:strand:+ start:181 stop:369 length:189 start_codon:yes stop_codon:yes gene_type:complete
MFSGPPDGLQPARRRISFTYRSQPDAMVLGAAGINNRRRIRQPLRTALPIHTRPRADNQESP